MSQPTFPSQPRWTQAFQRLWFLHWVMAAGFLIIYLVGLVMARLPREVSFRGELYHFHKSMGVLVLILLLLRIFILLQVFSRKYRKRGPKRTQRWYKTAILHAFLYFFMLVVPISGIFFSNSGGHEIPFFFTVLPNWFEERTEWVELGRNLHFWLSYTFLASVIWHGVEQRQFLRRVWKRWIGT